MAKLSIRISPVGKVEIDAEGFTGSACLEATKKILDGLTNDNADEAVIEEKEEMHMIEEENEFECEMNGM